MLQVLNKAQKIMVDEGFPRALFFTQEERAAAWAANPPRAMATFRDPWSEQQKALREQFDREAAAIRIAKMKAGFARKALRKQDHRGERWDPRNNRWVPSDPQEKLHMDDPKTPTADNQEAPTADSGSTPSGATENADMATNGKKAAKKSTAKKAAKKAAPAKKAGSDKPKGPGVIDTIVTTIARERGASIEEIMEVLVKKFPDREADSMIKTARIQANKNAKSKERDEKRGVVYFGNGKRL